MRQQPKFLQAFLALIVVVGVVIWGFFALTNNDALWFLRSFKHPADWVIIYWEGKTIMVFPGDRAYNEIVETFSNAIAHWKSYEGEVEFSREELDHYRDEMCLLELHYNVPVKVHTRHQYPETQCFFVPLTGTHAETHRVFSGLMDQPQTGVLNLRRKNHEQLLKAVKHAVNATP